MDEELIKAVFNEEVVKDIPIIYVMRVIFAVLKVEEQLLFKE